MKKKIKILAVSLVLILSLVISNATSLTLEPNSNHPHVATCGSSTFVLDADNSLWFFGVDSDYGASATKYLTPIKVMDNVKKVTLGNMSTTIGAYMPTCMILTYNNDLYIGGVCRYSQFNISENISLVRPEKIWDDVKDMSVPSGYGDYKILENDGDLHEFSSGSEHTVINIGNDSIDDYIASKYPERLKYNHEWINKYWWDIGNMKEEAISAGFYVIVKNDGSVWTGTRDWGEYDYYHGHILGNGTEIINTYPTMSNIEPVQIFPAGTCTKKTNVVIDGQQMIFDIQPIITNDRVMVPLRTIFEVLGAKVDWNQSTKIVTATKDDVTVKLTVGSSDMYVNDKKIELDAEPFIIDGSTLVPVRAIAESFDVENISWDGNNKTVKIETK